jgi:ATP-dependent helicase/nuclease subunit A
MENYLNTDKSIIISAPAGSGKTEKLARRYIALLQSGVNVERVLAITFTDKAAAEMKQRILRILKVEDNELFMSLMGNMPLMRVTTIHSFCGTLLRRFSFEASIDPNYRIEDAVDSRMVWEEILYEILMDAGKGERGHEIFFQTLSEKGFRGLDYLRSTIGYLYQKNPFSLEASTFRNIPPVPGDVLEELLSWEGVKDVLDHYEDFLKSDNIKNIAAIEKYFLTEKKEPRKKSVPLLKGIADYRDWAQKMYLVWKQKKIRQNAERAVRIREIFGQCLDKYNDRKRAKGILDFSDLEHLAYRMLTEHPEWANILYAFDEKTDHILVDEFQDTNTFQWAIVNSLTEEWRSGLGAKREGGTKPTVFFVGDEKQSVYYFRGANVEIFSRAKDKLQEWLGDEFCYEEIRDNYRSLPAIIDFTNHVFSRIMQTGEKPYPWITTYTTFNAHRSGLPDRGHIELILLDNEADSTAEAREAEAETLAQRIHSLEGNYQITDKQTRHQRPCRFMDMSILLRKRTHLKKYEEALKKYNIPYVAVKGIGFYQEPEVAMLRSLIFFLSDPHDDYSLYVLLKSPLFQMEESDILKLLNYEGSSLFEKLTAASRDDDTPDTLFDRPGPTRSRPEEGLANAAGTLTTWLSESTFSSIAILIERILVKTKAWMFFHEKQRQANIRKFIRIIEDLETNGKSLIKIRDVLERTADKSDEAKANVNTEGMDAVRIMTIHASKGLEFPIVFAPGMEEPFAVKTGENLIYEKDGLFFYKSEPESSIRKQDEDFLIHQAREEEEQKRLFYVLVTRAEEALFLLGRWSSRDKNFLAFLRQGLGLEKAGAAFSLEADINGLSVLSGEDVNMLYKHAPSRNTEKKAVETVTVFPLSIQKQASWKSVTGTVEIKRRHGQNWVTMGDILHRLFEGVSKGTISENDIMSRADIMLQSMGFHNRAKNEKLEIVEQDIKTLKDKGVWQDIILPAEDSYTELPFVLGSEDGIYSGRIDRMIRRENVCRIYDYKTFPVMEKEVPYLLKKYSVQLNIYKKAVKQIFNTDNVESYVVFTHTGEVKGV